jgi:hypothetical protein
MSIAIRDAASKQRRTEYRYEHFCLCRTAFFGYFSNLLYEVAEELPQVKLRPLRTILLRQLHTPIVNTKRLNPTTSASQLYSLSYDRLVREHIPGLILQ